MFYPIENGSVVEIPDNCFGFIFKCNLPPFGYGKNVANGKIEKTDVIVNSDIAEHQYWERHNFNEYNKRRREEKKIQQIDGLYVDEYCENIRRQEWGRRLRGVWLLIFNPKTGVSEYHYITGLNYMYIAHWKFQGKPMDFRIPDKELFYVVDYCMEDPDCLGINELTKRKNGKTARVGCWIYERTSRLNNHHGGLQSKTDTDAADAYLKAIVYPWQKLQDFFRPRHDTFKPNEVYLFATPRRGSKAEMEDDNFEEPLESFIDFMPSSESAYDGPELHSYVSDESGKTKRPTSIIERQNVTRYCTEIDGVMKGKHWYTTTVEPDKGEPENYEFQDMTANSNPLERDENNRTGTGLYTYFLPAPKGMMFDKYGYPEEERALQFINNTIRSYELKGDTRGLSSFKRKNPRSFKEAFSADGEFALYNPELLNNQLDAISWTNKLTEFGDLVWKDGYKVKKPINPSNLDLGYDPSEVEWVSNPNGKFERVAGWTPREPNKVYWDGQSYAPNNDTNIAIGCDPFKYDKTKDKRRSNCAAFAYQIPDALFPDRYDNMFGLRYAFREEGTRLSNEDILKMAWWCGSQVLFERNVNHWKNDFIDSECGSFLAWLPMEVEPGISMTSDNIQVICDYTEAYINEHINKVYFKTLLRKDTGWLGFKVEDTEKFDEPMGAGITLIAVKGKILKNKRRTTVSINDYFPKYRTA